MPFFFLSKLFSAGYHFVIGLLAVKEAGSLVVPVPLLSPPIFSPPLSDLVVPWSTSLGSALSCLNLEELLA